MRFASVCLMTTMVACASAGCFTGGCKSNDNGNVVDLIGTNVNNRVGSVGGFNRGDNIVINDVNTDIVKMGSVGKGTRCDNNVMKGTRCDNNNVINAVGTNINNKVGNMGEINKGSNEVVNVVNTNIKDVAGNDGGRRQGCNDACRSNCNPC